MQFASQVMSAHISYALKASIFYEFTASWQTKVTAASHLLNSFVFHFVCNKKMALVERGWNAVPHTSNQTTVLSEMNDKKSYWWLTKKDGNEGSTAADINDLRFERTDIYN